MARNDFEVEKAPTHVKILGVSYTETRNLERRIMVSRATIFPENGFCAANPENKNQPRDREWYLANVIAPMIERGEIDNKTKTPFDDRKLRYYGSEHFYAPSYFENDLVVKFGITHFKAFFS